MPCPCQNIALSSSVKNLIKYIHHSCHFIAAINLISLMQIKRILLYCIVYFWCYTVDRFVYRNISTKLNLSWKWIQFSSLKSVFLLMFSSAWLLLFVVLRSCSCFAFFSWFDPKQYMHIKLWKKYIQNKEKRCLV